jgi:4-amino-4-deoxychorismate lyase
MDRPIAEFSLIETLRFEPGAGFVRLPLHLARLQRSARRLGFPLPVNAASVLREAVRGSENALRVRLTFDAAGRFDVTTALFSPLVYDTVWTVRIASTRLDSTDRLLRVKTTRRAIYEAARAEYPAPDADEVLLLNEKGEVCEGTITTIFVDDGSTRLKTPPISCGLLAGVLRTELIYQRRARVGRIRPEDLVRHSLFVGNSLRGLIAARLVVS